MSEGMSSRGRAKQFAPFAALRGLENTLNAENRQPPVRRGLAEDVLEELNRSLLALREGDEIFVEYWAGESLVRLSGFFRSLDPDTRKLRLYGKVIPLDDIWSLQGKTADAE